MVVCESPPNRSMLCFASSAPSTLGTSSVRIRLMRPAVDAAASFSLARASVAGLPVSRREAMPVIWVSHAETFVQKLPAYRDASCWYLL